MRYAAAIFTIVAWQLAFPAAAQDVQRGEKMFKRCAACHQVGDGAENRIGPVLSGVIGRAAGRFEGYAYGASMRAAGDIGLIWDPALLFDYLGDPRAFLREYLDDPRAKAKMKFKLKKAADRRDVIAYLATFSAVEEPQVETMTDPEEQAASDDAICVRNASVTAYLFAVEGTGRRARKVQRLSPGDMLCVTAAGGTAGVVSVFENADAVEGCSRIVPRGGIEEMIKYVDFDRCFWSSNS